jgi:hypothetical protein
MHLSRGRVLPTQRDPPNLRRPTPTPAVNFVGEPKAASTKISDEFNHFKIEDPVCETSFGFVGCALGRVTREGLISYRDRKPLTSTGGVIPASAPPFRRRGGLAQSGRNVASRCHIR